MMARLPHSPYYIKTLSTLPVSLKMSVKLQYITDSRSLTSQKENISICGSSFSTQNFHFSHTWTITKKAMNTSSYGLLWLYRLQT